MKPKEILLTSSCCDYQDDTGIELLDMYASRLTRGQGVFTQSGYYPYSALHLLAQNIDIPSTVLEYPSERIFIRELRRGYEWIGITLSAIDTEVVLKMCEQVRKYSPHSKIVIGGCGISALKEAMEEYPKQPGKTLVDFFCEGEGVKYLRSLLGQPAIQKIRQYNPFSYVSWPGIPYSYQAANIIAGLGCPNQCFFCSTSHFFGGKHIEIADAETIFEYMKKAWREHPRLRMAVIFDEDFFRNKDKVTKLGKLIRSDTEFGLKKLNYFSFGSLESLEQYSSEELVLNGVSAIWIGAESLFVDLKKLGQRRTQKTFDSLYEHGISTIGSWIIGLGGHHSGNIEEDLEAFIQLRPILAQLSILTPMPGTPLWEDLKMNNELMPKFDWARAHLHSLNFHHPKLDEEYCIDIIERGHRELNSRYGPTALRDFWVHINGLKFCLNSQNRLLRENKAECHRAALSESFSILKSIEILSKNTAIRQNAKLAVREYKQLVGDINWHLKFAQSVVYIGSRMAQGWESKNKIRKPPMRKYQYNGDMVDMTYPENLMFGVWDTLYKLFQNFSYSFMRSGTKIK